EVDVLAAVLVPDARALAAPDEGRRAADGLERADRGVDAAGQHRLRAREELFGCRHGGASLLRGREPWPTRDRTTAASSFRRRSSTWRASGSGGCCSPCCPPIPSLRSWSASWGRSSRWPVWLSSAGRWSPSGARARTSTRG